MLLLPRLGFALVKWKVRFGLQDGQTPAAGDQKYAAQRTGVRGETYAYWYLRRLGYIFIARNYMPAHAKGELDLIGYDVDTLAFVEVRTRLAEKGKSAFPELIITKEKHEVLVRTAHYFLRERHLEECPVRFDVVAIDNTPASLPSCVSTKPPSALKPDPISASTGLALATMRRLHQTL